jgi:uncharacterized membrane protein YcaP (DUF421 family)
MLSDILWAATRSVFAVLLLLALTRILGRKALSQMTFFDFAIVITFGSVTANIGIGQDNSFYSAVTVLITAGLLGLLIGIAHIKSFRIRKLVNSEPIVLIEDGNIVDANMKKGRITLNELTSMLRGKNIFNISEVHYAVLENSGTLSVMPKAEYRPVTPKDLQLKPVESGFTKDIIIDGTILMENLNSTNITEAWLRRELKQHGISDIREVFYAGLASNGNLYLSKRTLRGQEVHGQHGVE